MPVLRECAETLLSTTTVSLAANGATTLYTVPVGKTFIPTKVVFKVGADAASTDITFGQVGALTDFLGTQQFDNADAAGDVVVFEPVPNATPALRKSYAAGTVFQCNVANQAGGASNTAYLFGFLV